MNKDEDLDLIINGLEDNLNNTDWYKLADKRTWDQLRDNLCIMDNRLCLMYNETHLTVVPKHLVKRNCENYHDDSMSGYRGSDKTLFTIKKKFYWPNMVQDVRMYCDSWLICQKYKTSQTGVAPLFPIIFNTPWELVNIDVCGPLVTTIRGNRYFLILLDHFSKYCVTIGVSDFTTDTTIQFLNDSVVFVFGTPVKILSDQERNFEAKAFYEFCKSNRIRKLRTSGYHPQCNGLAERTIRSIKAILRCMVREDHMDWDIRLTKATFAYNNTKHKSTHFAPNMIIFGDLNKTSSDIKLQINDNLTK